MWMKAKPVCPSNSCHIILDWTVLHFGNVVLLWELGETHRARCSSSPKQTRRSASVPFLITQNCLDITCHKVKQCPLHEGIGGNSLKLRSVWGILIYLEMESGDVVIKDSISQRSVWFNPTLPLTDGVFLTSALLRFTCHNDYYRTRHLPEIKHPSQV